MAQTPFEFGDDLSEYVQAVVLRLSKAGVPPELLDSILGLRTLVRLLETRDEDLTTYLNDGLTASTIAVSATTGTSIATATPTALPWEAEDLNEGADADWDSGDPTKVTLNAAGLWIVTASIGWAATATGARGATLRLNGATTITGESAPASTTVVPYNNFTEHIAADVGDYLEVVVHQDSGANKTAQGFAKATFLGSVG